MNMMFKFRTLLRHATRRALSFAVESADNNNAARMPMMAMTTSNSTSVKPLVQLWTLNLGLWTFIESHHQ
jgi:hypothetical protein